MSASQATEPAEPDRARSPWPRPSTRWPPWPRPPVPTTRPRARRRWRSRPPWPSPRRGAAADWARRGGWGHHPGLLRRGQPRPPLARGPHGDPQRCSRPSGPRTPRPTRRRWPRWPRPPASSASRRCASSATPPSPPPPSCPSVRPEPARGTSVAELGGGPSDTGALDGGEPGCRSRRPAEPERGAPAAAGRRRHAGSDGSTATEPRGAAGRARRPHRPAAGQARDPPAGRPAAGREAARGCRPEEPHDDPPPRVHGQPRHRQDDGGAPRRRHLPGAGLLSGGHLVEVDRSELVAGYLGQTATKTAEVVASAAGGVLFIDEAYSLTGSGPAGDQYGQESVDTLVKEMEDRRDDLVVIVAGYPAPMAAFIAANPGLASRFRTTIEFEDYTDDELVAILRHLAHGCRLRARARRRAAVPRGARPHPAGPLLRQRPLRPQRPRGGDRPPRLAAARDGSTRPSSSSACSWPATSTRNRSTREPPRWLPRPTGNRCLRTRTPVIDTTDPGGTS